MAQLKPVPPHLRYKFEVIDGDATSMVNRLKDSSSLAATRAYRWLVTKDERDASAFAVASALAITPNKVKTVMTVSNFIGQLGKCKA